jgi:hypothetical protein
MEQTGEATMTTETQAPEDWILFEAAKRSGWDDYTTQVLREVYDDGFGFRALCDLIAKHEKKPVDRKVLCAREAMTEFFPPHADPEGVALRAIELWEEGFGK